nr:PKD domain-containing protein [Saprospiraceae bacterium]
MSKVNFEEDRFTHIDKTLPFSTAKISTELAGELDLIVEESIILNLESEILDRIREERSTHLKMEVPLSLDQRVVLHLMKVNLFADGAKVIRASSGEEIPYEGNFYWGVVEGIENSMVTFSFFDHHLMGFISIGNDDYTIGRLEGKQADQYIVYKKSLFKVPQNFTCHVGEEHIIGEGGQSGGGYRQNSENCVNVYVEADYDLYQNKGSVSAASDYVLGLFNQVFIIFADEDIEMAVSELVVWDTPSPYNGPEAFDYLNQFTDELNGSYNGDIAHLVNLKSQLAGVAWTDILCWWGPETTGFSGLTSSYQNVPVYSWSVNVLSHEIGHNLGSSHTHACVWNNNNTQIDDCGNEVVDPPEGIDCYNSNNPILPSSGTIMSYCHAIGGIGIDFNNGFGPQPGDLIRSKVYNGSCLGECDDLEAPIAAFTSDINAGCIPLIVHFEDLSDNMPDSWNWTFEGGNPAQSGDQHPQVFYETAGMYDVTLEVSNAVGTDEITEVNFILVEDGPTASFNYNIDELTVGFINNSSGGLTYEWHFGDGNSSTIENPIHTYLTGGEFEVTLVVVNGCGADIIETTVTVIDIPTPNFDYGTVEGCAPLEVQFFNNSSPNTTSLFWEFPGGEPAESTEENPLVVYSEPGDYDVSLTASNDQGGETLTEENLVSVWGLPTSEFDYEISGRTITIENLSTGADDFIWNFGDGDTSTVKEPEHEFEEDGTYEVMLIAENSCGADTSAVEVVIATPPKAHFSLGDFDSCVPTFVEFINESTSNAHSYIWIIDGGSPDTLTDENPLVLFEEGGTYDVILIAISDGGTDTLINESLLDLLGGPVADFSYEKNELVLEFESSVENADSILWDFGDGNTSTDNSPVHDYDEEGIYMVSLSVWNTCDTVEIVKEVPVGDFPTSDFVATSDHTGCVPLTVQFESRSSDNVENHEWTFPGGDPATSSEEDPLVTYSAPGVYSVSLKVTNPLGESEMELENFIIVDPLPVSSFSTEAVEDGFFQFTNLSEAANTFHWDFDDGNTSDDFNPGHQYEEPGEYWVILIASSYCGADSFGMEVVYTGSLIADLEDLGVKVYPNPTLGKIYFEFTEDLEKLEYKVFNIQGREMKQGEFQARSVLEEIDLSSYPAGTYYIQTKIGNEVYSIQVQLVAEY